MAPSKKKTPKLPPAPLAASQEVQPDNCGLGDTVNHPWVAKSWISKAVSMSEQAKDRCFEAVAQQPLLAEHQAVSLLQGLPPNPDAYAEVYCLDDFALLRERMKADIRSDKLRMPCTPSEFAGWAAFNKAQLPDAFLAAIPEAGTGARLPDTPTRAQPHTPPTRHGGASTRKRDAEIHCHAKELVESFVLAGKDFKKVELVEAIASEFKLSEARASKIISAAGIDWAAEKEKAQRKARKR